MKPEDTVMKPRQILDLVWSGKGSPLDMDRRLLKVAQAQAEITGKIMYEEGRLYGKQESLLNQTIIEQQVKDARQAAIREVVEWILAHSSTPMRSNLDPTVFTFAMHMSLDIWQEQLKIWFKDNPELLKELGIE